ncbi:nuclease-related domain-containing protein [Allonocardiopsis opalescens]|uniref:Nuclease-like protein n=1 Tax=Allonocardiopsis opalescens TaxID=1144618 RepID=A0A2T0PVV6_9ACTN|nr:nuclease-related domain-containing protein [Allonocardiopsis opalescens]PRX95663.1 nuclease-like protein [Allonocardiopsis opalescens]
MTTADGRSATAPGQSHPATSPAGRSALARAGELARRELPKAVAPALAAGLPTGLVAGGLAAWQLGLLVGVAVAVAVGMRRWYRGEASRWLVGGLAERRTGRRLDPLRREGWTVLHDRGLPKGNANVDHLLIAPDGQVFNVDSKYRRGAVRFDARRNFLRIGRVGGFTLVKSTVWESGQIVQALTAELGRPVEVTSVLAVHRARLPYWHRIRLKEVHVLSAKQVRGWLRKRTGAASAAADAITAAAGRLFPDHAERPAALPETAISG